jgi:hypothetical protein
VTDFGYAAEAVRAVHCHLSVVSKLAGEPKSEEPYQGLSLRQFAHRKQLAESAAPLSEQAVDGLQTELAPMMAGA